MAMENIGAIDMPLTEDDFVATAYHNWRPGEAAPV
jgi:hypothetical protein